MKIKRPKNTKKKGNIEYVIYKSGRQYVGVCLTFNILEEGVDPEKLKESIQEAALLHLDVVRRNNLSDDLLNRYAPEKYWKIYFDSIKEYQKRQLNKVFGEVSTTVDSYKKSINNKDLVIA